MTAMPRSWKSASPMLAALGAKAPSRANSRKMTPFAIINCFTAWVNGGKLMDMVDEPRGMDYSVLCRAGLQRLLKNSARECDLKGHGFSRVVMSAESWASAPEGKSHFASTPTSLSG